MSIRWGIALYGLLQKVLPAVNLSSRFEWDVIKTVTEINKSGKIKGMYIIMRLKYREL